MEGSLTEEPDAADFVLDERSEIDAVFRSLKASTPTRWTNELSRLMYMSSHGTRHCFKHRDMRRSFWFDAETGAFSGNGAEGGIETADEAYEYVTS